MNLKYVKDNLGRSNTCGKLIHHDKIKYQWTLPKYDSSVLLVIGSVAIYLHTYKTIYRPLQQQQHTYIERTFFIV